MDPLHSARRAGGEFRGLLGLLLVGLGACGAIDSMPLQANPRCAVTAGEHRRYAITSWQLPTSGQDFAEDMDGDGKPDNQFGTYLAYGLNPGGFPSLPGGSLQDAVNGQLQGQGRGVLLLDVLADPSQPGCAQVTVRSAAPQARTAAGSLWQVATGSEHTALRAFGTQDALATVPYAKMTADEARTLELTFPLQWTAHHFRLYGARIILQRDGQERISGTIRGAIRLRDIDEAMWPTWAREFTALIHEYADFLQSAQGAEVMNHISALEEKRFGQDKCLRDAADCCHLQPATCHIYPEELREYYATSYAPDLDAFSEDGTWRLVPGSPPAQLDSLSVAFGFNAVAADFADSCPAGSFCSIPVPFMSGEQIIGGWSGGVGDLWLTTDAGRAWHYDGLSLWQASESLQVGTTPFYGAALWGSRSDDVWVGNSFGESGTTFGLRHWNGGTWQPVTADAGQQQPGAFVAMTGSAADDVWALGTGASPPRSQLLHFDGTRWLPAVHPAVSDLYALYQPQRGHLLASGFGGGLLELRDGSWQLQTVAPLAGFSVQALAGAAEADIWAVTGGPGAPYGSCRHFDGHAWSVPPAALCDLAEGYTAAWMDPQGVLWTGSSSGRLRRFDPRHDSVFTDIPGDSGGEPIRLLFGSARDGEVLAVAGYRKLLRYQP